MDQDRDQRLEDLFRQANEELDRKVDPGIMLLELATGGRDSTLLTATLAISRATEITEWIKTLGPTDLSPISPDFTGVDREKAIQLSVMLCDIALGSDSIKSAMLLPTIQQRIAEVAREIGQIKSAYASPENPSIVGTVAKAMGELDPTDYRP